MLHKRSSLGGRKVSPPQPTCMTPDQKASYLADLRNNRPVRPTGSRPLPNRPLQAIQNENIPPRADSALELRGSNDTVEAMISLKEQRLSHRVSLPVSDSYSSLGSQKGRPLVPSPNNPARKVTPPSVLIQNPYHESTARDKERAEAHALRKALEQMDQEEEERRIHEAAKQEAADLVWRHCNPKLAEAEKTAAYQNPDLRKKTSNEIQPVKRNKKVMMVDQQQSSRSISGGSTSSQEGKKTRLPWLRKRVKTEPVQTAADMNTSQELRDTPRKDRVSSGKRHVSSGSSKGIFRNPEDEIYEEAEEHASTRPPTTETTLPLRPRESNATPQTFRPAPEKSYSTPLPDIKKIDRFEIWRNPPTRSRDAQYTASRALPQIPGNEELVEEVQTPKSETLEIRGDDIRAATSMKRSDRSPKLPTPTAVSDRVGRPIVSFDPKWRAGTESPRNSQDINRSQARDDGAVSYPVSPCPAPPEITIMEVPRIQLPDEPNEMHEQRTQSLPQIRIGDEAPSIPTINVEETPPPSRPLPQINLPDTSASRSSQSSSTSRTVQSNARPLPSINIESHTSSRPLPQHTQSSPSKLPPSRFTPSEIASRVPWLSKTPLSVSSSSAACGACSLPISGRIVTASGSSSKSQKARFHPECFTCHHCSTGLECISFYPEPDTARLERIQSTLHHLDPNDPQILALVQGNEDLHFFCHLDFHELFSPRCHSCKTPVEGAVVLALGRHYHPDHFFCAECGDPFSRESPFVEHNNYPYCVRCHTRRTSARCRACKQQILNDMTIEALGGKWHDECFVCCDCGGDFGEEGRFFVREIEVELTEKEKRKGFAPKIEERAACQSCEERRVKNVNTFL